MLGCRRWPLGAQDSVTKSQSQRILSESGWRTGPQKPPERPRALPLGGPRSGPPFGTPLCRCGGLWGPISVRLTGNPSASFRHSGRPKACRRAYFQVSLLESAKRSPTFRMGSEIDPIHLESSNRRSMDVAASSLVHVYSRQATLCYAILLPCQKSSFQAGFRPDSNRENLKIGSPAGQRPA